MAGSILTLGWRMGALMVGVILLALLIVFVGPSLVAHPPSLWLYGAVLLVSSGITVVVVSIGWWLARWKGRAFNVYLTAGWTMFVLALAGVLSPILLFPLMPVALAGIVLLLIGSRARAPSNTVS
jgi:hypothetical protein